MLERDHHPAVHILVGHKRGRAARGQGIRDGSAHRLQCPDRLTPDLPSPPLHDRVANHGPGDASAQVGLCLTCLARVILREREEIANDDTVGELLDQNGNVVFEAEPPVSIPVAIPVPVPAQPKAEPVDRPLTEEEEVRAALAGC